MVKKLFTLTYTLIIAIFLNGCDSSTGSKDINLLVGEWEMTSYVITIDNVSVTVPADDDNNGIMILNSDGVYSLDGELDGDNMTENGTWSSTETKITFITSDSESAIWDYSFNDSNNTLIISRSEVEDGTSVELEYFFNRN